VIASDIMTRNVHTIHPDASAQEAASLLAQEHMSGAPVVDANGKVIGIVTADIVHAVAQGYLVIRPW
jgi:CBS domain-containing protein